jgi:hypothetical protein
MIDRIPFEVAIADPKLLKKHFDTLSPPQQVVLKAFNGLPLSAEPNPRTGRSELDYWAILQGACTVDELGFVTSITPVAYKPQKYDELVAILGRRSGKTDRITATQIAYEALLGGHMAHAEKGQDVQILFIAQDIDMAASHLNFINNAIMSSPLLAKEIVKFNADAIILKNGLHIVPAPPTITSSRGLAVPGWCGDEVGFWYTDAKSANPDFEVERAVEYAMAQFPNSFKFITSTPYTKEGMLWSAEQAGTNGAKLKDPDERAEYDGVLVVHASTAAMENPRINKKRLVKLQKKDPDAFIRESLAKFVDSISGFLNPALLQFAIQRHADGRGVKQRVKLPRPGHPEDPTPVYVASMDPAFRHDKFAFTVMHHSMEEGIVMDYFQEWEPDGTPLNPADILAQIKNVLDYYGIGVIYSDQYQLESLQVIAQSMQFTIIGIDFTSSSKAKIYGSFAQLVNQRRIKILDHPTIYDQLVVLEKRRTPNGAIQIAAPPGKFDDAAAACCLCAHQCMWLLPQQAPKEPKPKSHVEEGLECIKRRREEAEQENQFD